MRMRPSLLLCAFILALSTFLPYNSYAQEINISAVLNSPSGTVEVIRAGKTKPVPATDKMTVQEGDVIRTGSGSDCVLTWNGGHMLRISALSELTINKLALNPVSDNENFSMSLESGKVVARASKLMGKDAVFELKTPTAVAGVRGTVFSVEYTKDGIAHVKCSSGMVSLTTTTGDTVIVGKGKKAKVYKGDIVGGATQMEDSETDELNSTDFKVPILEITEPLGDMETGNSFILVHGQTNPGADLTVNGEKASVGSDGFFTAIVDLTEGDNEITVKTTGKAGDKQRKLKIKYTPGKKATGTVTEKPGEWKDQKKVSKTESETTPGSESAEETTSAPIDGGTFSVVYPPDGFLTRKGVVTIVGNATPGMTLYVNGSKLDIPADKQGFMVEYKLEEEGENKIVIADGKGESANAATLTIIKDTTPPMLEIIKPIGQFDPITKDCETRSSGAVYCTIIGLTESDAFLSINDMRQKVDDDGSFNVQVPVGEDETVLFIVAEDRAGNRATRMLTRMVNTNSLVYLSITASPSIVTGVADSSNSQGTAYLTIQGTNQFNMAVDGVTAYLSISALSGTEDVSSTLSASTVTISNGAANAYFYAGLPPATALPYTATIKVQSADGTAYDETQVTIFPDGPLCPPSQGTWTYNASTATWECQ